MDNQTNESTPRPQTDKTINGESVNVQQSAVDSINATNVTLRQAAAQSITTGNLVVRQGGLAKVKADKIDITQGGVGFLQTSQANLTASRAGVVVAGGPVKMDLSSTRILVSSGEVEVDQSAAVFLVGNTVRANNSPVVFLFARKVEGNVSTSFGPQESILFGAVAGLVAGVMLLLGNLFRRKRKK